jgi:Sep15/SelM redox domain
MPILKSFLKDGEAESYRNVEVKFVHGRKAIMTIYESGGSGEGEMEGQTESWVEIEQIVLSDYKTKVSVHIKSCVP